MKRTLHAAGLVLLAVVLGTDMIPGRFSARLASSTRLAFTAQAQSVNDPEPPRILLDTTYIPPTGGSIIVGAGGDIQAALNQAQPGDEIVIQAGATFVAPADGFIIPPKTNPDSKWITIRSSNPAGLPVAGTRVNPSN